jgi:hypothetical protein
MMDAFDERFLGRIFVARYPDGSIEPMTGHHRCEVCYRLFKEEYEMESTVLEVANEEEAARIANFLDTMQTPHTRSELDRQLEIARDPTILHLRGLIVSAGYDLALGKKNADWRTFTTLVPITRMWKSHGGAGDNHVVKVLSVLKELWDGQKEVRMAKVLYAMSHFLDHIAVHPAFDEQKFFKLLRNTRLAEALKGISGREKTQARCFAEWMMNFYNTNRGRGDKRIWPIDEPEEGSI